MVAPSSTRKGLPSTRSCSGRGRGRDPLFLAELKQDPPCPVLDAGRWSCHRRLEPRPPSPQQSPARDTFPLAGLSSSSVCRGSGTHSGTVPTGRGSKDETRVSTAGNRGVGLVFGKTRMALLANF